MQVQIHFIGSSAHEMSVYVRDGLGHRSEAATITINDQIDLPPAVYEFELSLDRSRATLEEGSDSWASFAINVAPQGNDQTENDHARYR